MKAWSIRRQDRVIGAALGAVAFAAYLASLSRGPYPGESADLVAQHGGFVPVLSPIHPVWAAAAWVLGRVPLGTAALRLNLFSAVCGALAVWVAYLAMSSTVSGLAQPRGEVGKRDVRAAGVMAGIGAAVSLAFTTPFWIASNRAHTASLDILLLLVAALLFVRYARAGGWRRVPLLAFLCGVGLAEFATFALFVPLLAAGVLYVGARRRHLKPGLLAAALACGLAGLATYFLAAWAFFGTEGYVLSEYGGYLRIVWFMWREQYHTLRGSLPRTGWMLVALTTGLPWLCALVVARRALNSEKEWAYYALHAAMTVAAVGNLLNLPFTAWPMLRTRRFLVTPHLLSASVFGYLVAYWYLVPLAWREHAIEGGWRRLWQFRSWVKRHPEAARGTGAAFAGALLGVCAAAPLRNAREAYAGDSALVNEFARELVGSLAGRSWLLTDGLFDSHIVVAAREMGRPVKLVNLLQDGNDFYRARVSGQFDDPRLRNLARIGLLAMVREWLATDPAVTDKLAVLAAPDLWTSAGFTPVPNRLLFLGARAPGDVRAEAVMAEHEAFWGGFKDRLDGIDLDRGPLAGVGKGIRRHAGRVANDMGFLMEELGQSTNAWRAYTEARQIDPNNLSALLNLAAMTERGQAADEVQAAGVRKDLGGLTEDQYERFDPRSLARTYGHVRLPAALARLGWIWAFSGEPGLAAAEFEKALSLASPAQQPALKSALAIARLSEGETDEGVNLFAEVLAQSPTNHAALAGMAWAALARRDTAEARSWLERAERAGVSMQRLSLQWARLHLIEKDYDAARAVMDRYVHALPDSTRAWAMLAAVAVKQGDEASVGECLRRLQELDGADGYYTLTTRALAALAAGEDLEALDNLERAARAGPQNVEWLRETLSLALRSGGADRAEELASALLRADPRDALGNYVLGTLQFQKGDAALAEDSLRRSLAAHPSAEAMNNLACMLLARGACDEAEQAARSAIALQDRLPAAWDTLGNVLLRTKRYDEAEAALDRALALAPGDARVLLSVARLRLAKGDKAGAREWIDRATGDRGRLPANLRAEIESLSREL